MEYQLDSLNLKLLAEDLARKCKYLGPKNKV